MIVSVADRYKADDLADAINSDIANFQRAKYYLKDIKFSVVYDEAEHDFLHSALMMFEEAN